MADLSSCCPCVCVCREREREELADLSSCCPCVCVKRERERGVGRPFLLLSLPDAAYVVIVLLQRERERERKKERERESLRPHTLAALDLIHYVVIVLMLFLGRIRCMCVIYYR